MNGAGDGAAAGVHVGERVLGMMVLLALLNWTGLVRQVCSKIPSYRQEDYVMAGSWPTTPTGPSCSST